MTSYDPIKHYRNTFPILAYYQVTVYSPLNTKDKDKDKRSILFYKFFEMPALPPVGGMIFDTSSALTIGSIAWHVYMNCFVLYIEEKEIEVKQSLVPKVLDMERKSLLELGWRISSTSSGGAI